MSISSRRYFTIAWRTLLVASLCGLAVMTEQSPAATNPAARQPNPPAKVVAYYVSPRGSDSNPGTFDLPFKTLEKARDLIRQVNRHMRSDIVVYLRGGRYQLQKTFDLTPADSGANGFNVVYEAYPDETPILSGGRIVTGWVRDGARWKAFVGKGADSRQLYVNGNRATRARSAGEFKKAIKTATGYTIPGLKMANWQNLSDVEIVSRQFWRLYRCGIDSVKGSSIIVKQPCWGLSQRPGAATIGTPTWIENALELLDAPGDWYLNRATGWLYYKPRAGENMATARVVLPELETLMKAQGTPGNPVHNLVFRGITFADATWLGANRPAGFSEVALNVIATPGGDRRVVPANVSFDFARAITLDRNVFTRLGAAGLALDHVAGGTVANSQFEDISGNGIDIGGIDHAKTDNPQFLTTGIAVHDNVIRNVAVEYQGGVGIWLGLVQNSVVRNNDIGHIPYTGIAIGWGHGTIDPTVARNNLIKANFIHDYMTLLRDGGGIYSLGAQPGNVYAENVIVRGPHSNGGIYLDDGSRYIEVTNNVVVGNQRTAMIKGADNSIHDNWWQRRGSRDVWLYKGKSCLVLACDIRQLRNNHVIAGIGSAPKDIVARAGVRPATPALSASAD